MPRLVFQLRVYPRFRLTHAREIITLQAGQCGNSGKIAPVVGALKIATDLYRYSGKSVLAATMSGARNKSGWQSRRLCD